MTHFSFDIVGFDLDGTLLDTSGDLAAAVNHALTSVGRPELSVEQVKPMIGGGARHMLKQGLTATGGYDEAMLDTLHATLLAYYEANICVLTKPYPGVIEALDALAANGVTLGIVTNKIERFARTVLDQLGLTERFACILGGDTLAESKPSPMPVLEMVKLCQESGGGGGRAKEADGEKGAEGLLPTARHRIALPLPRTMPRRSW